MSETQKAPARETTEVPVPLFTQEERQLITEAFNMLVKNIWLQVVNHTEMIRSIFAKIEK